MQVKSDVPTTAEIYGEYKTHSRSVVFSGEALQELSLCGRTQICTEKFKEFLSTLCLKYLLFRGFLFNVHFQVLVSASNRSSLEGVHQYCAVPVLVLDIDRSPL